MADRPFFHVAIPETSPARALGDLARDVGELEVAAQVRACFESLAHCSDVPDQIFLSHAPRLHKTPPFAAFVHQCRFELTNLFLAWRSERNGKGWLDVLDVETVVAQKRVELASDAWVDAPSVGPELPINLVTVDRAKHPITV